MLFRSKTGGRKSCPAAPIGVETFVSSDSADSLLVNQDLNDKNFDLESFMAALMEEKA